MAMNWLNRIRLRFLATVDMIVLERGYSYVRIPDGKHADVVAGIYHDDGYELYDIGTVTYAYWMRRPVDYVQVVHESIITGPVSLWYEGIPLELTPGRWRVRRVGKSISITKIAIE